MGPTPINTRAVSQYMLEASHTVDTISLLELLGVTVMQSPSVIYGGHVCWCMCVCDVHLQVHAVMHSVHDSVCRK